MVRVIMAMFVLGISITALTGCRAEMEVDPPRNSSTPGISNVR